MGWRKAKLRPKTYEAIERPAWGRVTVAVTRRNRAESTESRQGRSDSLGRTVFQTRWLRLLTEEPFCQPADARHKIREQATTHGEVRRRVRMEPDVDALHPFRW